MHKRASYSLIILLLATFVAGCSVSKDRFRLSGKFKHLHSANIYIYSENGHDTIRVDGGKFVYEKKLSHPVILTIQYPNFAEMKIVAEPGRNQVLYRRSRPDPNQAQRNGGKRAA